MYLAKSGAEFVGKGSLEDNILKVLHTFYQSCVPRAEKVNSQNVIYCDSPALRPGLKPPLKKNNIINCPWVLVQKQTCIVVAVFLKK